MTRIFLYPYWPATTFPGFPPNNVALFQDPGNWTTNNMIECVGAGGTGRPGGFGQLVGGNGSGGGGGGYGWATNLAPTFPVRFQVQQGISFGAGAPGDQAGSTWWVNWNETAGSVMGGYGQPAVAAGGGGQSSYATTAGAGGGSQPGTGTTSTTNYPQGHVGGAGGQGQTNVSTGGAVGSGGGGGAGGPHGVGSASPNTTAGVNTTGGAADGSTVPAPALGSPGLSGTQWDRLHGVGSGASAANAAGAAPTAGQFGGGGGGGFGTGGTGNTASNGSPGLIVITYEPTPPPPTITRIFIHPNVTSFPNPGNWNPGDNKVECVGLGGYGGRGVVNEFNASGAGGGGGGYAFDVNLNPTFPVAINVTPNTQSAPGSPFSYCYWSSYNSTKGSVWAGFGFFGEAAANGSGSFGGGGGAGYPNFFNGGTGGSGIGANGTAGAGGGGGAAGPDGAGGNGVNAVGNTSGGGGTGDGGNVTGGAVDAAGVNGTTWDASHGIGSGGGAGSSTGLVGHAGGQYGGGGGGGFGTSNAGGIAGNALMVVTYTPLPPPDATVIYLHANVTRFPDPGNWNPANNKVECVGAGGMGAGGVSTAFDASGAGGAGGGYAYDINLSPTFPVPVNILSTNFDPNPNAQLYSTSWVGTNNTAGNVYAISGSAAFVNGSNSLGGPAGAGYPNAISGGAGGNGQGGSGGSSGGGGGGGAAGPLGAGGVGGNSSGGTSGTGGSADGGGTPAPTSPGPGINGTQWDASHGCGSGGHTASTSGSAGQAGGSFGGGGSGGWGSANTPAARGQGGLIVITYVPLPPPPIPPEGQVQILA